MTDYCMGFMFNDQMTKVALIRKTKPDWQAGFLNGIGGKLEDTESPLNGMVREFKEETGYNTSPAQWRYFGSMQGEDWTVFCFKTTGNLEELRSPTDEKVEIISLFQDLRDFRTIPNLRWMIPLALEDKCLAYVSYQ